MLGVPHGVQVQYDAVPAQADPLDGEEVPMRAVYVPDFAGGSAADPSARAHGRAPVPVHHMWLGV